MENIKKFKHKYSLSCCCDFTFYFMFSELKKFDDAIEIFNIVSLETVVEYCGLALAYYASGQLEKSYKGN